MPQVVACPRCSVAVAVASSAVARLRCPVCQQEFAPSDAPPEPLTTPLRRESNAAVAAAPAAVAVRSQAPSVVSPARATVPRQPSSGGWLSNLVGVLGGGFLGLAAGYYLLNYFGGPQYDFLNIPLPYVAHTQPGWIDPELSPSPSAQADGSSSGILSSPTPIVAVAPDAAPSAVEPDPVPAPAVEAASEYVAATTPAAAPEQGETPAAPQPAAPRLPGPSEAQRFTPDDLDEALVAAHASLGCPTCNSTGLVQREVVTGTRVVDGRTVEQKAERQFTCEVCHGRPVLRLTQEVYLQLCHLAEVATFVAIEPGDASINSRKESLRQVLLGAAGNQDRASALGRLAGHWLANTHRGAQGIVLAGTVRDVGRQGPFYLTKVVLFGLPKEVTVVSVARSPFQPRDRVLIAGSIIDEPAANLAGYDGSLPQVVWGGLPLRLPADSF